MLHYIVLNIIYTSLTQSLFIEVPVLSQESG
jgi:hypothetical protein